MKTALSLVFGILFVALPIWATLPQRYNPPETLTIELKTQGPETFETDVKVVVTFRAEIGTAKAVDVELDSSRNLKVAPASLSIGDIVSGTTKTLEFIVQKTDSSLKKNADYWVQLRVTYTPDYEKMLDVIKADTTNYPQESAREGLLERIRRYQESGERVRKAITYNFEKP
jgi:hypothetical protein